MTSYAIQAGALRANPNSGPDGVGVQADIAYTLEARAEVQAVASISNKAVEARAKEPSGGQVNIPDNDNRPIAVASNSAVKNGTRFLSVCSGIEAASQAWPQWDAVAFSEIEKFPSAVLAHHYPDVPNLGDFTKIDTTKLGRVDVLAGGTPCQAFSVAGKRGGLDDARGNLTLSFVELAHDLADGNGLRNVVWENVVGVLSDKGNAFGCFLAGLVGADAALVPPNGRRWSRHGMVAGPKGRAAWAVKDAQFSGVAQRRRRVIVIADFGNGADPAAVLFEPESVCRDSPPSREKGEKPAPTISARTKGGGGLGTDFDLDGGLVQHAIDVAPCLRAGGNSTGGDRPYGTVVDTADSLIAYAPDIARCDATREGSSQDYETTTMVAVQTLDGSEVARTLSARHDGSPCADRGPNIVAQTVAIRGREGGATAELGGPVATALRASQGGGDKPHVLAFGWQNSEHQGDIVDAHVSPTLDKSKTPAALQSAVRRLTPVECERLQGFPDNWTNIPWRGKLTSPDGPRYKALGNSWAVPLFAWLGKRIEAHMPPLVTTHNNKDTTIAAA